MELAELQEWFGPGELDPCPSCRELAALAIEETSALLCFHCGYIRWRGGETSVKEIQRGGG